MKITNKTRHSTREIRRVLSLVHAGMARTEGRLPTWAHLRVEVVPKRKGSGTWSGYASFDGYRMCLRLRRVIPFETLAQACAHELMHSYGHKHPRGMGSSFNASANAFVRVIRDRLPAGVLVEKKVAKKTRPGDTEKIEAVDAAIKRWTSKAKRAATAIRKLRAKRKYHERRLAKAAGVSQTEEVKGS